MASATGGTPALAQHQRSSAQRAKAAVASSPSRRAHGSDRQAAASAGGMATAALIGSGKRKISAQRR